MVENIHFISGLPRSGSTLLCAVLRQNPRFISAMTSPLSLLCGTLIPKMSVGTEFATFFDDERRRTILRKVFDGYYAAATPDHVVFDTNRTWTSRAALVKDLYPRSRIICCVRELWWIIDSIEHMLQKNPLQVSRLFNFATGASIFSRVETLMHPETGLVGLPYHQLREAWFGASASQLILVKYETLVREPQETIKRLYEELGEPPFQHDLDNLVYDEPDYDAALGLPGMHKVRQKLEEKPRKSCLPPEIPAKFGEVNFWAKPEANRNGVTIL